MLMTILILVSILILCYCIVRYKKGNWIDYAMKRKSKHQIFLLIGFVLIVFVMLVLIHIAAVPTFGSDKPDTYLFLFGLFSQTENANHEQSSMAVYIFQLIVSLVGAICFGGILISTISNIIQRRVDSYTKGEVRYSHLYDHNIIIGANELLEPALRHLKFNTKNKKTINRVTLVLTTADAEITRARIRQMGVIEDKNLVIYRDNIFNKDVVKPLNLPKCKQIIIIGDKPLENCDIGNTNIADNIYKHVNSNKDKRERPLPVFVSFFDDAYFLSFCKKLKTFRVYFYPFNYNELCIANVWGYKQFEVMLKGREKARCSYIGLSDPLDRRPLHLYILGFNAMGQEVLKATVKWAHFLDPEKRRTQINIFVESRKTLEKFLLRYPIINGKIFDMDINFTIQSQYAKETMDTLKQAANNTKERSYIVICSNNNANNFMLATHLPTEVYKEDIPILVQFDHNNETIQNHFHENNPRFKNIHFFGFRNNDMSFSFGLDAAQELLYLHAFRKDADSMPPSELLYKKISVQARKKWEATVYNNVRQTHISCVHGFGILFQELGFSSLEEADDKLHLVKDEAKDILQRFYMGWYTVAGIIPTNSPQSKSDEEYGCFNELFTYEELKKTNSESFHKRDKRLEEYTEEIKEWLIKYKTFQIKTSS